MKLPKKSHQLTTLNDGFTLVELSIVVVVLGILGSFGITNITKWSKLAKVDEATTILNTALVECLQLSRGGTDPSSVSPDNVISNDLLESSSYKIKTSKDKCSDFFITPLRTDEKHLFEMGYQISADNVVTKIATPADNQSSLKRCKRWAGSNCGASEEQKRKWLEAAKLAKDKKECNDKFFAWLNGDTDKGILPGTSTDSIKRFSWSESKSDCVFQRYAFEGALYSSQEQVEIAKKNKLGVICDKKVSEQKELKTKGFKQFPKECSNEKFYFCNGVDQGSQDDMEACEELNKGKVCENTRDTKVKTYEGKWGPDQHGLIGPEPCGTTYWMCKGTYTTDENEYKKRCPSTGGGGKKTPQLSTCLNKMGTRKKIVSVYCTGAGGIEFKPESKYCPPFYNCMGL